ncbi:hypothetical protein EV361DRAFT_942563 [Lentinula raphanica]|nr:hypothetical protein EV361DRAFT_942563 [Lentinula raphanica]
MHHLRPCPYFPISLSIILSSSAHIWIICHTYRVYAFPYVDLCFLHFDTSSSDIDDVYASSDIDDMYVSSDIDDMYASSDIDDMYECCSFCVF